MKLVNKLMFFLKNIKNTNISFSQEGEDILLIRLLQGKKNGFYVDVGAHHPFRYSNTALFYKRGWSGINIDAMPRSMEIFNKKRKRDVNLELAVGVNNAMLKYYIFEETALNTFDEALANKYRSVGYKINKIEEVCMKSLESIFDDSLKDGQTIDFLDVDVEGMDLEALKSNNWDKYRPCFVLVEILNVNVSQLNKNEICNYMKSKGYVVKSILMNSVVFEDCERVDYV